MHPGTPGSFRGREVALTSSGLSPVQEGPPNPAFWPKVPPDMGRQMQVGTQTPVLILDRSLSRTSAHRRQTSGVPLAGPALLPDSLAHRPH